MTWTDSRGVVQEYNICCGVQDEIEGEDDVDFSAESLGDYIFDELKLIGVDLFEDVDFICGDNCATNRKLAQLITARILENKGPAEAWTVPLVGCNSHRLNLCRQDFYNSEERSLLLQKVDGFMKSVRALKNSSKLRKQIKLCPQRKNSTRWTSCNDTMQKMKKLEPFIPACGFDDTVLANVPTALESATLEEMIKTDGPFKSTSLALQRGGDNRLSLAQVRDLFDKLIEAFPETAGRLGPASTIVQSPHFENAVVKVQSGQEGCLSRLEKEKIKRFLQSTSVDEDDSSSDNDNDTNWADKVIAQEAKRRKVLKSKYRPMHHIASTSNIVERLFSRAKLIMRPHRKLMSPYHLELLIFLRSNRDLWNEETVDKAIKKTGNLNDNEVIHII